MRALTAYFAGAGTIVAAIAVGLGGGIVAGNVMHPIAPKQGPDTSKIERRADATAPVTIHAPSERVQYLTGSQAFGAMIAVPARAQDQAMANAEPPAQPPSQVAAVEPSRPPPASPPQAATPAEQQASTEPASQPDGAVAKARDSDVKRAASERRRAERHERSAERHRYDYREQRGMRDRTDWDDVARNIREDTDARYVASRPRGSFLFGPDD